MLRNLGFNRFNLVLECSFQQISEWDKVPIVISKNKNSTNSLYSKKVGKMIGDTDKQTQFNKSVYSPLKRTRSFVKRTRSFKKRP